MFDNIKPLFANKPLLIVANKSDIWRDNLSEDKKEILESMRKEVDSETILEMSNKDDEDSVNAVKVQACEMLLQHRVEQKFKSKKTDSILNRIHVAEPAKRDNRSRPAFIPEAVFKKREMKKAGMEIDSDEQEDEEDDTMVTDGECVETRGHCLKKTIERFE